MSNEIVKYENRTKHVAPLFDRKTGRNAEKQGPPAVAVLLYYSPSVLGAVTFLWKLPTSGRPDESLCLYVNIIDLRRGRLKCKTICC
jgi:hypothetical protein